MSVMNFTYFVFWIQTNNCFLSFLFVSYQTEDGPFIISNWVTIKMETQQRYLLWEALCCSLIFPYFHWIRFYRWLPVWLVLVLISASFQRFSGLPYVGFWCIICLVFLEPFLMICKKTIWLIQKKYLRVTSINDALLILGT